jgi:glucoside 3-dehydrogenase (cytochrome c) hitch-hiker subunit
MGEIVTNRRTFLLSGSVLLGSAALGSVQEAFAAATPRKATFFTENEMSTLLALVDVVLPATDSPAASAADTHYFIDLAIPACASAAAQKTFRSGLRELASQNYASARPATQVALLKQRAAADLALDYDASFFKILKDYTLTGYFLSEIGATQALSYERVPGGFWGDIPLAPNQKAWAI